MNQSGKSMKMSLKKKQEAEREKYLKEKEESDRKLYEELRAKFEQ